MLATPVPTTGTLLCHIAESRNCSPPPSSGIAVSATICGFVDARAAGGMGSTPSPLRVLLPLTLPKMKRRRPSGPLAVLFSGTGWVWGIPVGPPPHPGTAVHSAGSTALHWAAFYGNRRIVRLLIDAKADVNARTRDGCAVSASASAECGGRVPAPSAVQDHAVALCRAIWRIRNDRRTAHARRRRGRPKRLRVTLRCAAHPTEPHSRARAGARRSKLRKLMGSSRSTRRQRHRCTPPVASDPPTPPPLTHHYHHITS